MSDTFTDSGAALCFLLLFYRSCVGYFVGFSFNTLRFCLAGGAPEQSGQQVMEKRLLWGDGVRQRGPKPDIIGPCAQ